MLKINLKPEINLTKQKYFKILVGFNQVINDPL